VRLIFLVAFVGCAASSDVEVSGAEFGYVTPTRIAGWVTACRRSITSHQTALTLDVECRDRPPFDRPSWQVGVFKEGAIADVSFFAETKQALVDDLRARGPAIIGPDHIDAMADSVETDSEFLPGARIHILRSSSGGSGANLPRERMVWSAPVRESRR
jgi:hypothetical protein